MQDLFNISNSYSIVMLKGLLQPVTASLKQRRPETSMLAGITILRIVPSLVNVDSELISPLLLRA